MPASSLPNIDAVKTIIVDAAREVGLGKVLVRDSSTKDDGSMVTETDRRMQEQLATIRGDGRGNGISESV